MTRSKPRKQAESKQPKKRPWRVLAITIVIVALLVALSARRNGRDLFAGLGLSGDATSRYFPAARRLFETSLAPRRMSRPFGMAPVAWQAFLRACAAAQIHPDRIGQTMGDHPRSVGYHLRDGTLNIKGQRVDYCAAVDIGVPDLDVKRRQRFLRSLFRQGFVAWYREGPKWKNGEHIHAVYVMLPMKPQLREQVLLWMRERRAAGKARLRWEIKLRRTRQFRRYFS